MATEPLIPTVVERKTRIIDAFIRAIAIEPLIPTVVERKARIIDAFK